MGLTAVAEALRSALRLLELLEAVGEVVLTVGAIVGIVRLVGEEIRRW